jgi:hypothetical protein
VIRNLRTKLAAVVAAGGLAAAAHAQPPVQPQPVRPVQPQPVVPQPVVPQPVPGQGPQVYRWNGGYVVIDGPGVIVRQDGVPGGPSMNVVSGSGNGVGNKIVVSNGPGSGGVTVVQNSRNGVGNTILVNPNDLVIEDPLVPIPPVQVQPIPANPVPPVQPMAGNPPAANSGPAGPAAQPNAPQLLVYKGKANTFWTKKTFSETHDCNLYWSPADKLWFRYNKDDDTYRPVLDGPPAPND